MTVSILDLHCLNAVTDDYEDVASIIDEVRRTSHGNVSRGEVVAALVEMHAEGLVAAYGFEPQGSRFVIADSVGELADEMWFRIAPVGQRELEVNWVDA